MKLNLTDLKEKTGIGFGTSGVRGLVTQLSDYVCYAYTLAFIEYLQKNNEVKKGDKIALAGDRRSSTSRITLAVAQAISDAGYQVIHCGQIPTPAVIYYGINHKIASIMVTGSHIPDDRNGIKFNKPEGEVLKSDEAGILATTIEIDQNLFDNEGKLIEATAFMENGDEASKDFIQRYTDFFTTDLLKGKKIGLYGHSAVGRKIVEEILGKLGAEVVKIDYRQEFVAVDTEAVDKELMDNGPKWIKELQLETIVSTDGDSDRPLLSDENGNWLRGDITGILTANYLGAEAIATPISCNTAVEKCGLFGKIVRTKIGSPYVVAAMNELTTNGVKKVVGYEANGGFFINDEIDKNGKRLKKLPTRDAIIVLLACLALAKEKNKTTKQLVDALPQRFSQSGSVKDFPTDKGLAIVDGLTEEIIKKEFGFMPVVESIDTTDGTRITFDNQEIIHLRPSRNAPEFRVYVETNNPTRTEELVELTLAIIGQWKAK